MVELSIYKIERGPRMNLKVIFKIDAIVALINGLGLLFMTATFLEAANFEATKDLNTVGQFTGVTFLFLALLTWRIPDIVKDGLNSLGRLYAIGHGLWFLIIGYHVLIGAASGPTAWINIIVTAIIGILYVTGSRKPD